MGFLLEYHTSCCATISLPELLEAISGLVVEFPRLVVLGDFNLLSLGVTSEAAQKFMTIIVAMDLFQIIRGLNQNIFVCVPEQCDLVGDLRLSPLASGSAQLVLQARDQDDLSPMADYSLFGDPKWSQSQPGEVAKKEGRPANPGEMVVDPDIWEKLSKNRQKKEKLVSFVTLGQTICS